MRAPSWTADKRGGTDRRSRTSCGRIETSGSRAAFSLSSGRGRIAGRRPLRRTARRSAIPGGRRDPREDRKGGGTDKTATSKRVGWDGSPSRTPCFASQLRVNDGDDATADQQDRIVTRPTASFQGINQGRRLLPLGRNNQRASAIPNRKIGPTTNTLRLFAAAPRGRRRLPGQDRSRRRERPRRAHRSRRNAQHHRSRHQP